MWFIVLCDSLYRWFIIQRCVNWQVKPILRTTFIMLIPATVLQTTLPLPSGPVLRAWITAPRNQTTKSLAKMICKICGSAHMIGNKNRLSHKTIIRSGGSWAKRNCVDLPFFSNASSYFSWHKSKNLPAYYFIAHGGGSKDTQPLTDLMTCGP